MSKLEKFIDDHRSDFDDKIPSEKLWQNIEDTIVKKEGKHFTLLPAFKWSVAAAVVIVFGLIGFVVLNKKNAINEAPVVTQHEQKTPDLILLPEESPQVNQFARIIALKQAELKVIAKEQPALYQKFTEDIIQLDSSYHLLKIKLSNTSNREMLVEAMIQNLQLQLNVLNQQLNIIQQIKQSKKYSHEKNISFI